MPRLPWNFNADRRRAFDVAVVLSSRRKNARQRLAGKKRVALAALKKRQRAGRTQRPGPKRGTYLIGLVREPRPSVVNAAAELFEELSGQRRAPPGDIGQPRVSGEHAPDIELPGHAVAIAGTGK